MIETIAIGVVAYGIFLVFVLSMLHTARHADELTERQHPERPPHDRGQPSQRDRHHSAL